jgi:HlyD family secretion protein
LQIDVRKAARNGKELREIEAKVGELTERKIAAEDQMRRIDLRAPQDGTVHQSAVHTVGGVITAGEILMLIVPEADKLIAETKIAPQDIDQLWIGQTALLRFTTFNQRTTPETAHRGPDCDINRSAERSELLHVRIARRTARLRDWRRAVPDAS